MTATARIVVRAGTADDRGYAVSTFVRSALREERLQLHHVRIGAEELKHALARLVDTSRLVVACLEDEPDTLCGWALAADDAVLWVYVAKDFRGHGLAKKLKERAVC